MIKVMIVDDEFLVRVGLKSTIDWKSHGFEITAEASNGLKALDILRSQPIDIMLLDIEMPEMNGIELLSKMKEEGIETNVIILSSHSDFEYARQALKMGCIDYVLKLSIEPTQLIELLNSVKNDLIITEHEVTEKTINYTPLISQIKAKNVDFQQSCIDTLKYTKNERMTAMVIGVDQADIVTTKKMAEKSVRLNTTLDNIVFGIINDYTTGECMQLESNVLVCTLNISDTSGSSLIDLCENIQNALRGYLDIRVTIAIGKIVDGFNRAQDAFITALEVYDRRFFLGPQRVITYRKTIEEKHADKDILLTTTMESGLKHAVELGDELMVSTIIDSYESIMMESEGWFTSSDIFRDVEGILFILARELKLFDKKLVDIKANDWINHVEKFREITFAKDLMEWLKDFIHHYFEYLMNLRNQDNHPEIMEALTYIQSHYSEDLSVSSMASRFHMSNSYFGSLFKKETGEGFTAYITSYRVEKSKELLRSTDMTVSEVAETIGYENIYYFSNVFKKVTGISPKGYQKKIREGQ